MQPSHVIPSLSRLTIEERLQTWALHDGRKARRTLKPCSRYSSCLALYPLTSVDLLVLLAMPVFPHSPVQLNLNSVCLFLYLTLMSCSRCGPATRTLHSSSSKSQRSFTNSLLQRPLPWTSSKSASLTSSATLLTLSARVDTMARRSVRTELSPSRYTSFFLCCMYMWLSLCFYSSYFCLPFFRYSHVLSPPFCARVTLGSSLSPT